MNLLLLGGTGEAKSLAVRLHELGINVIYSIAGLVRQPELPCTVISGGFSQYGGLLAYLQLTGIDTVLDATHPYAASMSNQAVLACQTLGITCYRYERPAWSAAEFSIERQLWYEYDDWSSLAVALVAKKTVFLTTGQITTEQIEHLQCSECFADQHFIARTAVDMKVSMPANSTYIRSIGPFSVEDEIAILQQYKVDALVTKNSGGGATAAKLHAARECNTPVFVLKRPRLRAADYTLYTLDDCVSMLNQSKESLYLNPE